jgi:DNA-binding transcriptional regulator LsrR (DeoR family)
MASSGERDTLIYEAAWLHHQCRLPQKEVARRLGVDKATVSRWMSHAIEREIVSIYLRPPGINELEMRLRQAFRLRRARVIPSLGAPKGEPRHGQEAPDDEIGAIRSEELGKAAAAFIGPTLSGNIGIGLGGGTSVAAFARHLCDFCPTVALKLFALSVSSREPFSFCATSVTAIATSLLTFKFQQQASREMLERLPRNPVPLVEGHALRLPEKNDNLKWLATAASAYYEKVMHQVEIIVTGIGAIESCWVLNDSERIDLRKQGAIGDILYDIYGEYGTPIKTKMSALFFPFSIARLRKMVSEGKEVIAICANKVKAIIHALTASQGQFVTGLVTDERTARDLLRSQMNTKACKLPGSDVKTTAFEAGFAAHSADYPHHD